MAKKDDTTFFENKLLDLVTAKVPMLEMLQWEQTSSWELKLPAKRELKKEFTQKAVPVTDSATESDALTRGSERFIFRFRRLQDRGLEKVLQRCMVHFMRNIVAYVLQKEKEKVAARLYRSL